MAKDNQSPRSLYMYIDYLSVISSLGIVLLHSHGEFYSFEPSLRWAECVLFEIVFGAAVPCFYMISGATLMDYRKRCSTREYCSRRIRKTVIPFLFWSLFAACWSLKTGMITAEDITPASLVSWILNSNRNPTYWFFLPLFAIYLSIPVLSLIPEKHRRAMFRYLILCGFLFASVLPFLCGVADIAWNSDLSSGAFGGYVLFPVTGYYIHAYNIPGKLRKLLYAAGAAGFIICFAGTILLSYKENGASLFLVGNFSPFVILYSAAVFTWFRNHRFRSAFLWNVVSCLRDTTFGVYLLHKYGLDVTVLAFHRIFGLTAFSPAYMLGGGLLTYLGCMLITKVLLKIPVLRRLVS